MDLFQSLFVVPKNQIFARHPLATRRQQPGEALHSYLSTLKLLATDYNFKSVTSEVDKQDMIRDVFINDIQSHDIRQRLLENVTLTLNEVFSQARLLELAEATF